MEGETALELWNDGIEDRLYHCDVESPQQGNPALRLYTFSPPDVILEGRVTPPLNLFDQLDSPTFEELFEQNWQLFEESDQKVESFCAHKNFPEDLDLMDSPKVICSVIPEPTCLTKVIQAMVMYPPSVKKLPKKRKKKGWARHKKSRPPRTMVVMVSDDEKDDEVVSEVQKPPGGTASLPSGMPTGSRVLPPPPDAASEVVPSFAEHFARCAVDWDYPRALFSIGGYEPDPAYQKLVSPKTGETFVRPALAAQSLTGIALEQKSTTTLGAKNEFPRKKRSASSNLSDFERVHGPRISASRNGGLENLEPTTRPAPRQNKRRRLIT